MSTPWEKANVIYTVDPKKLFELLQDGCRSKPVPGEFVDCTVDWDQNLVLFKVWVEGGPEVAEGERLPREKILI